MSSSQQEELVDNVVGYPSVVVNSVVSCHLMKDDIIMFMCTYSISWFHRLNDSLIPPPYFGSCTIGARILKYSRKTPLVCPFTVGPAAMIKKASANF